MYKALFARQGILRLDCYFYVAWCGGQFLFSPARGDPTADRGDAGGAVLPGVNARGIYAYPIVLARTRVVI
ncbi:hypothetical protein SEEH1831_25216 [Salmonella enterica subsp. enterica serovar Heidelberg str. 77-1831]|nr:hypothetical protein SEEH1831_25216 [Salmonella enterica subsp. enterica serovar Heidelberg str. 77-1831]